MELIFGSFNTNVNFAPRVGGDELFAGLWMCRTGSILLFVLLDRVDIVQLQIQRHHILSFLQGLRNSPRFEFFNGRIEKFNLFHLKLLEALLTRLSRKHFLLKVDF